VPVRTVPVMDDKRPEQPSGAASSARDRGGRRPLAAATFSGMRWSYTDAAVTGVMQLLYVSIMSRLLTPAAFGIMAIAFLIVNFGQQFSQMGVAQALIQRPEISADDVRAGFTASVALGVILFAVLWLISPQIAAFFTMPESVPVLRVMGAQFIFSSLGVTSQGLLRRDLRFKTLAVTQLSSYFVGYMVIGLALAYAGAGVWSLVIGVLAVNLLSSLSQYAVARHDVRPLFSFRRFDHLYGYGARVSGVNVMQFLTKQLDTFAVGRYASTALLGQYNRAFTVVSTPMSRHLMIALSRVLLPAYSKIQHDSDRLGRAYASVLTLGGTVMLSIAAGMAVAAQEIVSVILGDQWNRAADFVPFFAFALAIRTMSNFAEILAQARDDLRRLLVIQVIYLLALWGAYVAVERLHNIVLFAVVLMMGELVKQVVYVAVVQPILGLRVVDWIRAYAPAIVCALITGTVVLGARVVCVRLDVIAVVTLFIEVLAGAVGLAVGIRANPYRHLRSEFGERFQAAGALETQVGATAARLVLGRW